MNSYPKTPSTSTHICIGCQGVRVPLSIHECLVRPLSSKDPGWEIILEGSQGAGDTGSPAPHRTLHNGV